MKTLRAEDLKKEKISIRVMDLYSVKPVDEAALKEAARETRAILVAEDHFAEGGLGEAVRSSLAAVSIPVYTLAVRKKPKSGKPDELLDFEEISRKAFVKKVKEIPVSA